MGRNRNNREAFSAACFSVLLKFIFSEKATKFYEIPILLLTVCTVGGDFANFCVLLRKYQLYYAAV